MNIYKKKYSMKSVCFVSQRADGGQVVNALGYESRVCKFGPPLLQNHFMSLV